MASNDKIRILCVDDHPVVHDGISFALQFQSDMELVGGASNGPEALEQFRRLGPDVTLMDLQMPGMSGLEALEAIRRECPTARVIVLTTYAGDVRAKRAISAGASGYLLKSTLRTELVRTIRYVQQGLRCVPPEVAGSLAQHYDADDLTEREIEILRLIAAGNSNKMVGCRLSITEETVKSHVKNVLSKLSANDRTHAVQIAMQRGFLALP
ncbi:DNA-binding response regulator [Rhodanobacter glycinis]|uniref:response regulator n=1 Tax=Rhodanobacter glycinis TaxID=582702 RepID=UPI00112B268D|nr:response regulator transcription factor [Rhodanobacter glycinis]TPG51406.1 DNA-binding response regulator [Rhodanobacter glycinis]